MKLIYYLFPLAVFFSTHIYVVARQNYTAADSVKIYSFCEKAEQLRNSNNTADSALSLLQRALQLAKSSGFKRGQAKAAVCLAEILFKKALAKQADSINQTALQIAGQLNDPSLMAAASRNAGIMASYFSKQKQAIAFFEKALALKYEAEQSIITADIYNRIGNANMELGRLDSQMQWQTKALTLCEKWKDEKELATVKDNLAGLYLELGKKSDAIEYARQSVEIRKRLNNYEELATGYNNLAQIYHFSDSTRQAQFYGALGLKYAQLSGFKNKLAHAYTTQTLLLNRQSRNKEALEYEKKAIAILEETGDQIMLSRRYISAAILSQHKDVHDSAGAVYYYQKAIDLATAINAKMNLRDVYFFRSGFYRSHRDFEKAYADYTRHILYRDSLVNEETKSKVADIESKYESEKKDNEIKRLSAEQRIKQLEIAKQKSLRNFLTAVMVLALIMGFILFNRYQIKKKLEKQTELLEMRNTISRNLHDDIGASLSNINILNELAKRNIHDTEKSKEYLVKSGEDIQHISESLGDIVWNINPKYDDPEQLFIRMKRYAGDMLDGKNIRYTFSFPENLKGISLSMDKRRDLYLIFKEAVNNLAKYSQATDAGLSLEAGENNLKMIISDNGTGFDSSAVSSGNGLNNMKQRSAKLNGQLTIISKKGSGTSIELTMPAT